MVFLDISCERSIRNSWHITDICIEIFLRLPPAWISSSVQASMKPHGCLAVDGLKMYHFAESFLTPKSMVYHHVLHRSCKFWGLCTFFSQSRIKTYQNHWGSSKTRLYPSRPCPAPWFWAYFLRSSLREGPRPYPYDLKLVWSIFFQSFPISQNDFEKRNRSPGTGNSYGNSYGFLMFLARIALECILAQLCSNVAQRDPGWKGFWALTKSSRDERTLKPKADKHGDSLVILVENGKNASFSHLISRLPCMDGCFKKMLVLHP